MLRSPLRAFEKGPASLLLAVALLIPCTGNCAPFQAGPVTINIPDGFVADKNVRTQDDQISHTELTQFVSHHPGSPLNTYFQVTVFRWKAPVPALSDAQLDAGARKYLDEELKQVAPKFTDFKIDPAQSIRLAGIPGAKLTWHGRALGIEFQGIMYVVIVTSSRSIVFVHIQDPYRKAPKEIASAVAAAEGMSPVFVDSETTDPFK